MTGTAPKRSALQGGRKGTTNFILTLMVLPAFLLITIFHYFPLPGVVIAFSKFNIGGFQSWVGFDNFKFIFSLNNFWRAFGNNWLYVLLNYLFIFPSAIILAILFNEIRINPYKNSSRPSVPCRTSCPGRSSEVSGCYCSLLPTVMSTNCSA